MASFVMSISPSSLQAIPQAVSRDECRQAADRQLRCFSIEGIGINDLVVLRGLQSRPAHLALRARIMPAWALPAQQHDRGSKPQETHHQGISLVCVGLCSGEASMISEARFCKN